MCKIHAQDAGSNLFAADSLSALHDDSAIHKPADTTVMKKSVEDSFYTSRLTATDKPMWFDIEQHRERRNDAWIFIILVQLLIILTVLKLAFSNDFENLFRSFMSSNIASQIGRTAKDDITLSSVLMSVIFITTMSVFSRFVLLHFYPHSVLQNNFSIVTLIFLFTFFTVGKYALLKYIGNVFDIAAAVDEYLFNLSAVTRTIGISMIPTLFVLYASSEKYFAFIFVTSIIILCVGIVMIVYRGLSTSYKLMYSSVYHFLIYICVGEILPVFLFFKLLTKTAI
jgi:hypothetical protein